MDFELRLLWAALVAYVIAGVIAVVGLVFGKRPERSILVLLVLGLVLQGWSIGARWERLGHGPYVTMFEILSSNVWSLIFIFTLVYLRYRPIRPAAGVVLPLMFIMMGWLLVAHPGEGHLPPTYNTIWLYIHIILGKIFLGGLLVAVGLGGIVMLRWRGWLVERLARLPNDARLDDLAYRFVAVALIFDTLMLIAGAIWAQDAWGRYWAWDPLETWAFLTWLTLAIALHTRVTFKVGPRPAAAMIMGVFVLAFLTFFGVPFVSVAPHKGAV